MKCITGTKIILPNEIADGKVLLFDKKIIGIVAETEISADADRRCLYRADR